MRGQVEAFVEATQSEGRYAFTVDELRASVSISPRGELAALSRLERAGRIVRPMPKSGFVVIVPAEYRTTVAPPMAWWLDAFMIHLGRPDYYVGLLTAAEWHGSAHDAIQEAQTIVPTQLRSMRIGRERLRFITKSAAAATPVMRMSSDGGSVLVSTPEATVVDLVRYATLLGGPSRIATVLSELQLSASALHDALKIASDITAAQRLGYLLEVAGQNGAARTVARYIAAHEHRTRPLDPGAPTRGGEVVKPWNLIVNAPVELG